MFRERDYPLSIPTYENGKWGEETAFETFEDFKEYLLERFQEPGEYEFDDSVKFWQEQSIHYNEFGYYCKAPVKSRDYIKYWNDQKRKSRLGVIYKNGDKSWYLTRDYYFWLNFLPIFDKEKNLYDFPLIWDIQYHMALYEILAEFHHKHAAILKKRQIASSYFHCAKLINYYWFEEGAKLKIGASLKDYINLKGSWKMLNEYSDFLNEHTAWIRPHNPGKVGDWEQKIQMTKNGRDVTVGLKSTLSAYSFDKDATTGVGGPCRYFFHEEGGIAPKADQTYEFMRPALHSGMISTGMFIIAGSVGDLDQCEPLKEFMLHPEENDFYSVESDLIDEEGSYGKHALFLPEQWSMPPFIDPEGNSQVKEALVAIKAQREIWKRDLDPSKYQLRVSQKPINIKEAFAFREESKFPLHLLTNQVRRIDDKQYHYENLQLSRGKDNQIVISESKKSPIRQFPVRKNDVDKEGCVVVWERPSSDAPEFGTYYGSIDPVSEGKTTTSDSLCSIYIYKNTLQVSRPDENGDMKTHIEQGRIVACWCGRYDDINETHARLEMIIEWYNAWTLVENNISLFIQHMIAVRKQKYLVPKDQMLFLKNVGSNKTVYQDYGWKNTGTLFKDHMISYCIEFLKEQLDVEQTDDGEITNIVYGVERIPDIMLMKEMSQYHDGLNVDRLVSFAALVAFVRIQESNRGYKRVIEEQVGLNLDKSQNLLKLKGNPFSNIGGPKRRSSGRKGRSGFKNLR
tara:strand:+ start:319 stop:2535 length:2217 start_codon:yes stop_codon:yes gene_type:complete